MMTCRRWLPFTLLLALTLGLSGCSWIMVRQAETHYDPARASHPPDCTASLGPAIGDTWDTIAVGGGLLAAGATSLSFQAIDPAWGIAAMIGGAGLGTMFGTSAHYGYTSVRRCRRLRDEFQTRLYHRIETNESK